MRINEHRNKPFGPGGGTRRLHLNAWHGQFLWFDMHFGGGEIGSTRA